MAGEQGTPCRGDTAGSRWSVSVHLGAPARRWALPGAGRQQCPAARCPTAMLCVVPIQTHKHPNAQTPKCPNTRAASTPSHEPAGCFECHLLRVFWHRPGRANHTGLFSPGRFLLPLFVLASRCGLGWSWRCWDGSTGAAGIRVPRFSWQGARRLPFLLSSTLSFPCTARVTSSGQGDQQ